MGLYLNKEIQNLCFTKFWFVKEEVKQTDMIELNFLCVLLPLAGGARGLVKPICEIWWMNMGATPLEPWEQWEPREPTYGNHP